MSHGSPLSINYDKLEFLLAVGQWKEAERETDRLHGWISQKKWNGLGTVEV